MRSLCRNCVLPHLGLMSVNWSETNNAGLYLADSNLSAEMDSQYNASRNYQPGAEFLAAVHDPTEDVVPGSRVCCFS